MKNKIQYWKIFNYRLRGSTNNVEPQDPNGTGGSGLMLLLAPFLLIVVFIEWLWIKALNKDVDPEKYNI